MIDKMNSLSTALENTKYLKKATFIILALALILYDTLQYRSGHTLTYLLHDSDQQAYFYIFLQKLLPSIFNDETTKGFWFNHGKTTMLIWKAFYSPIHFLGGSAFTSVAILSTTLRLLYLYSLYFLNKAAKLPLSHLIIAGGLSIVYFVKYGINSSIPGSSAVPHDIALIFSPFVFGLSFKAYKENSEYWKYAYAIASISNIFHPSFPPFLVASCFTLHFFSADKTSKSFKFLLISILYFLLSSFCFGYLDQFLNFTNKEQVVLSPNLIEIMDFIYVWRNGLDFFERFINAKLFQIPIIVLTLIFLKKNKTHRPFIILMGTFLLIAVIDFIGQSKQLIELSGTNVFSKISYYAMCTKEIYFINILGLIGISYIIEMIINNIVKQKQTRVLLAFIVSTTLVINLGYWKISPPIGTQEVQATKYFGKSNILIDRFKNNNDLFIVYPPQSDNGLALGLYLNKKIYIGKHFLWNILNPNKKKQLLKRYQLSKKLYDSKLAEDVLSLIHI